MRRWVPGKGGFTRAVLHGETTGRCSQFCTDVAYNPALPMLAFLANDSRGPSAPSVGLGHGNALSKDTRYACGDPCGVAIGNMANKTWRAS